MSVSRVCRLALAPALATLLLAGCGTPTPSVPAPSGSASPTVGAVSDEEALARATTAYAAYLAMIDTILGEGGTDPERIRQVATGQAADDFIRDAAEFTAKGQHSVGRTSFDSVRLQSNDSMTVRFYVCIDVSALDLVNQTGQSQVDPAGGTRIPFVAEVPLATPIVERDEVWTGTQFCSR